MSRRTPPKNIQQPPAPVRSTFFRILNDASKSVNGVPTLQLFGDIGVSQSPDWYWGGEGGAGTFKEFADQLAALGPVPQLRVEIHSFGGDVFVGKAIHDKLLEHPAEKTAVVYGICASAATYPALACQRIQVPANAFMVIHNTTSFAFGDANDMTRAAVQLNSSDATIADLYAAHTGKPVEEIRRLMNADTWLSGREAVDLGLADEVIEPITITPEQRTAPENFARPVLRNMPEAAKVWFDSPPQPNAPRIPRHLNHLNHLNHLMSTQTAPAPASATPPVSTPAPTQPPTPTTNVVTQPTAASAPVTAPVAPQNDALSPEVIAAISAAVTVAVQPLQNEVERLRGLQGAGITAQNLAGAAPVAGAQAPQEGSLNTEPATEAELRNALAGAKDFNEKRRLINAYDARKHA